MPRAIQAAAIQLLAAPGAAQSRLEQALIQVEAAAQAGAQLIVLPEVFNTGYAYRKENYLSAETSDGPTLAWMKDHAARLGVYLAGSLLLRDGTDIYNSLFLVAPNGHTWRYDKRYPWGWERAYFRGGQGITIAETEMGSIGMLICWDCSHPDLWRAYAGKVDLMLISSCPPDIGHPCYQMPDGTHLEIEQLGPVFTRTKDDGIRAIRQAAQIQCAWLGVPAISTVGCGQFVSHLPNGRATWLAMLPTALHLARYLPQANDLTVHCGFVPACMLLNAHGEIIAEHAQDNGEGFAMAEIELAARRPTPRGKQPPVHVSLFSYLVSDFLLPGLCISLYRRGARATWGAKMAPLTSGERFLLFSAPLLIIIMVIKSLSRSRNNTNSLH